MFKFLIDVIIRHFESDVKCDLKAELCYCPRAKAAEKVAGGRESQLVDEYFNFNKNDKYKSQLSYD